MSTAEISLWHRISRTRLRDALRGRFDASLDWRRIIAEAELPAELADMVAATVRATRLRRSEKVDVARELVAHFQDGLERGRAVPVLVATFGDPKQTAALIRRAKKRGRPLAWQLWHWACVALGAMVVVYSVMIVYQMRGRPTVKVNYLAILNKRAVAAPKVERAWLLYRQALGQMMVAREFPEWSANPELGPTDAQWPAAVAWLTEHEAALALVRGATERAEMGLAVEVSPKSFSPADQQLFFEPNDPGLDPQAPPRDRLEDQMLVRAHLPHLLPLRSVAYVMAIDARRAALAGDGDTALADVRAILGIAEHVQQMPCLIVSVTAVVIQRRAYAAVEDVLAQRPELWSPGQMRDLAHAIAATEIDWRSGIDGERAVFYDIIQRFYTDDGRGDGRLAYRGPEAMNLIEAMGMLIGTLTDTAPRPGDWRSDGLAALALPAANLAVASRKEVTDMYDQFTDGAMEKTETPLWIPVPTLEDEINALMREPLGRFRYMFLSTLMPAYDVLRNRIAEASGERDGVLVGLALESFHRERGSWPTSLEELSPRWLPTVPVDRLTGESLGYKTVDDRPVVYSRGVDRDDDGGRQTADREERDQADPGEKEVEPNAWPPRAGPPPSLASPEYFQPRPLTDRRHDGDWVIWSARQIK